MGDNKAPGGPTSLTSGVSSGVGVTYNDDPPGLHEKVPVMWRSLGWISRAHLLLMVRLFFQVEYLLREWVRLCHQPGAGKESEKAFSTFVSLVRNAVWVLRFRLSAEGIQIWAVFKRLSKNQYQSNYFDQSQQEQRNERIKLLEITSNLRKAWKRSQVQCAIGFSFALHFLKNRWDF